MKNSQSNPEAVVTTTTKEKVQNAAVTAVKVVAYPAHLVCQTAADLLNIGQAKAINMIDGTPIYQSMMEQESWTRNQQAKVVDKYMQLQERIEKQREANRKQDIAKLEKALDKLQGVEHITKPEPSPIVEQVKADVAPAAPVMTAPAPPAPTKEEPFVPINKRKKADAPVMTAPAMNFEPVME